MDQSGNDKEIGPVVAIKVKASREGRSRAVDGGDDVGVGRRGVLDSVEDGRGNGTSGMTVSEICTIEGGIEEASGKGIVKEDVEDAMKYRVSS